LGPVNALIFSKDGKKILSGSDDCIKYWDAVRYRLLINLNTE